MLIWVADYLAQFESGFGVFKYLTLRTILSVLTSLLIFRIAKSRFKPSLATRLELNNKDNRKNVHLYTCIFIRHDKR